MIGKSEKPHRGRPDGDASGLRRGRTLRPRADLPRETPPSSGPPRPRRAMAPRRRGVAPRPRAGAPRPTARTPTAWSRSSTAWSRPHPWLGERRRRRCLLVRRPHRAGPWRPFGDLDPALAIRLRPHGPGRPRFTHAGHGTFLAGLVRQIAPDAQVLSVPVMYRSGIADEVLAQHALDWLVDRRGQAQQGHPELFVDVVNLSFGEYLRGPRQVPQDGPLLDAIRSLGRLGVRVVASAGNRATESPVVPAAFAPDDPKDEQVGLVSVGALDPDGETAMYCNHGSWVTAVAPGTALVSSTTRLRQGDPGPMTTSPAPGKGRGPQPPGPRIRAVVRHLVRRGLVSATIAATPARRCRTAARRRDPRRGEHPCAGSPQGGEVRRGDLAGAACRRRARHRHPHRAARRGARAGPGG